MIQNVNQKNKEELLEEFSSKYTHNTLEGEQYTAAIIVKSAADIENSTQNIKESVNLFSKIVKEIGEKSDKLSSKIFWLNIVLAIATVVGALATLILAFK